jgi:hypothetical protein
MMFTMAENVSITGDNPFSRTLPFLDGSGRFFSRPWHGPWSVSRQKRLTFDHMGPPFGRDTAEKRLTQADRVQYYNYKNIFGGPLCKIYQTQWEIFGGPPWRLLSFKKYNE